MLEKRNRLDKRKTDETNLETRSSSERWWKDKSRFRRSDKLCTMGTRRIWTSEWWIEKWTKRMYGFGKYDERFARKKRRST